MYQTFSGTARRRPQVNLSGRGTNPFAKTTGNGGGAQAAVASAQQDRAQRALQRERVQASTRIQKTWRGRQARRRTFAVWRAVWDDQEDKADGPYATQAESLQQLRRLMLFYAPRRELGDVDRLAWYGTRQITTSEHVLCTHESWPAAYAKLIRACLAALQLKSIASGDSDRTIVGILAFAARQSQFTVRSATEYYEALTSVDGLPAEPLQAALLAPLQCQAAYSGLVVLLEHPQSTEMLALLSTAVNVDALSEAVAAAASSRETTTRARLWLLGNVIYLAKHSKSMSFTSAVARLLGSLAEDIDFESHPVDLDNRAFDELLATTGAVRLNTFLHAQVSVLLDQNAIRNLLVGKESEVSDAQALAGYALTLLRCFSRQGDNIRMWLHLGPTHVDSMSPTRYLWEAAKQRHIFEHVRSNSRGVVPLLKNTAPSAAERDDWTIVLVFLEMFSFDLKIMDDEEFMGNSPVSKRNSAVPSADVALLVTFCKNLGFALYYDAAELNEARSAPPPQLFPSRFKSAEIPVQEEQKPSTVAGLPGLTFDYLRGLVTALLRAIYERDSRRKFLPKDHWLMTDRFDMSHFIGGVVEEEERRHMVQEQDDEDKDDDSEDDDDDDQVQNALTNRANAIRAQERRQRQQRKASRQRYLQSVAPKLEILQNMPFIIPFHTRVETFRQFVYLDQEKRRHGAVDPDLWRHNMMSQPHANGRSPHEMLARHHAKIKRTQEFEDAFEQFYELGADLKEPIQITFVDQWDMPEAGIDGGGVTKEFLTSVINQAFDQKDDTEHTKYFIENEEHLLYPNPTAFEELKLAMQGYGYGENTSETRGVLREYFQKYEFLGRIIGKCLYEGILVDVSFAGFFLKKWALTGGAGSSASDNHYRPNINDLRELDEGLYKGLLQVKNADNVEELGMTFSVNDVVTSKDGRAPQTKVVEVDLIPNGSNTPVTNQNRLAYINAIASYRLKGQAQRQSRAFLRGLSDIIQPSWLSMFNQSELQTLIGGSGAGIDMNDLRKNTLYGGTYSIGHDGLEHPSIQLFWKVFSSMPDEDRRKVLKFVTSTPRGPLLGFSHLNPKFSIRDSGADENRFPTTSTCVNLLKLPMYKSEKVLREKLLAAVNSGAGFDLS